MEQSQEIKLLSRSLKFIFIFFLSQNIFAQTEPVASAPSEEKPVFEEVDEGPGAPLKILNAEPNKKRIRRNLSLIAGVKHDEEFLIPNVPLSLKGRVELIEMQRIKGTDVFRILPTTADNGIVTVHNKKTGQIYLEIRLDITKQDLQKNLREIQALLVDIEGIEYKIINNKILLDGFVLLPNDLIRIGNVLQQFGDETVKSLVSLNPLARKKMIEYISRDINNPEVTLTAIGDFVKVEGMVNSKDEEARILNTIEMYLPATVNFSNPGLKNVEVKPRDMKQAQARDFIINNLRLRPAEDKSEPPPKMIQIVIHFVELSDRYSKSFNFGFSPTLSTVSAAASGASPAVGGRTPSAFSEAVTLLDNLLPKINWARNHGFLRVLDTASVLTQDKNPSPATINRTFNTNPGAATPPSPNGEGGGAAAAQPGAQAQLFVSVKPIIKSERSGLIEMDLTVNTTPASGSTIAPTTAITTKISVRDRQSAAFGGIINKKSSNDYGGPSGTDRSLITLNHGKKYEKASGNFVVFVTPIIKASANAGVEQIKKKFRMKE